MEITFGSIWGAALAFAMNKHHGELREYPDTDKPHLPPVAVYCVAGIHVALLYVWTFCSFDWFDAVADLGIPMTILPFLLITAGGRRGASLMALPLTALPIAAKTFVELCVDSTRVPQSSGFAWFVVIPIAMLCAATSSRQEKSLPLLSTGLVVATLVYFSLNFGFFDFPWPWQPPTGRTVSAWIFTFDVVVLLTMVAMVFKLVRRPHKSRDEEIPAL